MRLSSVAWSLIAVVTAGCSAAQVVSVDPTSAPPSATAPSATVAPSPTGRPDESVAPSASAEPHEPAASAQPLVSAPTGFLPPGSIVRVTGDGVRVRAGPSISADRVTTVDAGQLLALGPALYEAFGPVEADGHSWYPVAVLDQATLPSLADGPLTTTTRGGWVAGEFLELLDPRCSSGVTDLSALSAQAPWERYACNAGQSITFEGTFGCGGCGGVRFGVFEPVWLAYPLDLGFISVEPNERIGPMTLHFSEDGPAIPDGGSILRVRGHFADPAAANCVYQPEGEPGPTNDDAIELYCQIRFVVERYEVIGNDADFPTG